MINKFTLKFKDQKLESQYQQHQQNQFRYPLFKHLTIGLLIAGIVKMFQALVISYSDSWRIYLFLILIIGIFGLLVYKKKQFLRIALVFINHLIILDSLELDNICSPYYQFMRGATTMSLHLVILMTGEIVESYFSIISISLIRLILLFKEDQIYPYSSILISIILIGHLQYTIYQNNLAFRCQFQLSYLDNQWDQIITQLINEPYLLIGFNKNLLTFKHKKSSSFQFNCVTDADLKNFLRTSKLQSKDINLEKYFFSQVQESIYRDTTSLLKQIIQVNFEKLVLTIQYSIFYGVQPMILLQIVKLREEQFAKTNQQAKIEKLYEFKYKKLLQQTLSRLESIIKKRGDYNLQLSSYKQVFYLILVEYCQCLSIQTIHSFNIGVVFKKLKLIYQNRLLQIENPEKFRIVGNKHLISLLLINIIEASSSYSVKLKTELSNEFYEIIVESNFTRKAQYIINSTLQNYTNFFLDYKIGQYSIKFTNIQVFLLNSTTIFLLRMRNTLIKQQYKIFPLSALKTVFNKVRNDIVF